MSALYFIAILTADDLTKTIRGFQHDFAENFESSRQLKIPVHITLVPPFKEEVIREIEIVESLRNFASGKSSFAINLNGFGQFREKVIFVDVEKNEKLERLYRDLMGHLKDNLNFDLSNIHSSFNPHITLANRDLTHKNFIKSWSVYKEKEFHSEMGVDSISILKHNGKFWEELERFELCENSFHNFLN